MKLAAAIDATTRRYKHGSKHPLPERAQECRVFAWEALQCEGQRLSAPSYEVRPLVAVRDRQLFEDVSNTAVAGANRIKPLLQVLGQKTRGNTATSPLRFGTVGPGSTGCADVSGEHLNTALLLNGKTGIPNAMNELQLHVCCLPAVRLPANFQFHASTAMGIFAKWAGGTKYDSAAIIWRDGLPTSALESVSTGRRMWVQINGARDILFLCVVYLQRASNTTMATEMDQLWAGQFAAVEAAIDWLMYKYGLEVKVAVAGDFDFQPLCLGGTEERTIRRKAWNLFYNKFNLILANSPLALQSTVKAMLPVRRRQVEIAPGSTRHSTYVGRAIDLTVHTLGIEVSTAIHSSVDCCSGDECTWAPCTETAGGDHFVLDNTVHEFHMEGPEYAAPRFPLAKHLVDRWSKAYEIVEKQFKQINLYLDATIRSAVVNTWDTKASRWVADALAWIHIVFASSDRDAHVHTGGPRRASTYDVSIEAHDVEESDVVVAMKKELQQAVQHGHTTRKAVDRFIQHIKKPAVTPPARMMQGEAQLKVEQSHVAWVSHIKGQFGNNGDIL